MADWRFVDAPGVGGATYGLQRQKSAVVATRSVVGLGYRVNSRISLGVSFGADYNSNTLQAPYIFQSQPVVKGLKTLLDLRTDGFGFNGSAGALIRLSGSTQVSVAWKSKTTIESTGSAAGNLGQQFAVLGLAARPDFHYSATVRNVLPQSVTAGLAWRVSPVWMVALQGDWIGWRGAFRTLPVALTAGTQCRCERVAGSSSLNDGVPLDWKNQFAMHVGCSG